ncbi:hypothetical protein GCM10010400_05340 [Streptomyces aculeolatus]
MGVGGAAAPDRHLRPYPHRLRDHFESVIWRFRSGAQWREAPEEFGNWSTVYDRFRQWRDAGVFQALMEAVIAEATRRDQVDLSLVSVDSTTARAHHGAAGMGVDAKTLAALEKALTEERGAVGRDDGTFDRPWAPAAVALPGPGPTDPADPRPGPGPHERPRPARYRVRAGRGRTR